MNEINIDVFKDAEFSEMRVCLDSEMKRLQKSEPLTIEKEELNQPVGTLAN